MPQLQLPIVPAGAKEINQNSGVQREEGKVVYVYVHGHLPVFQHDASDLKSSGCLPATRWLMEWHEAVKW